MNATQKISFIDSLFFIGFDAHLKNWKVTIRLDGLSARLAGTLNDFSFLLLSILVLCFV